jgi:hypothetical protein
MKMDRLRAMATIERASRNSHNTQNWPKELSKEPEKYIMPKEKDGLK